ncbi:MAG TPA: hypothetical protein VMG12_32880 [Polyangiaceae bacterium]|nr:hypothetical protein [Polyangiaceae bacterium]
MSTPSRDVLLQTLRGLLGDAFALHQKGAAGARLGRSYGMADGYMRALMDLGVATQKELGVLVVEERTRRLGPATQTLSAEPSSNETKETIAA